MRIGISGAGGFIGRHLAAALRGRGDHVIELNLRDPPAAARLAAGCDAVVNLAGESLAQRWNAEVKRRVMESRTALPAKFLGALAQQESQVKVYVSASAVGYYGTSETKTFTENDGPGDDFLAGVCIAWEHAANTASQLGMRVAIVRTGLVLGTDGGALPRLVPVFKSGTGGRAGTGKQWYSWIHIDDVVALYLLAIDHIDGPINATAPNPVRNETFSKILGEVLHRPSALPVPGFILKAALGEGAVMVLEGQRVLPARALKEGFAFRFPELRPALMDLFP